MTKLPSCDTKTTDPDRLMTTAEVADLYQLSERSILRMVKSEKLPAIHFGRALRFKRKDVLALIGNTS